MASPKKEGFLTDQQREVLKIAVQNAEVLSTSPSPRSPTSSVLLQELYKNGGGGNGAGGGGGGGAKAPGAGPKHVRRCHSGKLVKVKKGYPLITLFFLIFVNWLQKQYIHLHQGMISSLLSSFLLHLFCFVHLTIFSSYLHV